MEMGRYQCWPFSKLDTREVHDMRCVRTAFLAAATVGLMAIAAPASAQVYLAPDGHYYRLVPVKKPLPKATEMVTGIPEQATANVADTSNCRLDNFGGNEGPRYEPAYVATCGLP
jgi:hypothetical protein